MAVVAGDVAVFGRVERVGVIQGQAAGYGVRRARRNDRLKGYF
jgi:hypothetical protein